MLKTSRRTNDETTSLCTLQIDGNFKRTQSLQEELSIIRIIFYRISFCIDFFFFFWDTKNLYYKRYIGNQSTLSCNYRVKKNDEFLYFAEFGGNLNRKQLSKGIILYGIYHESTFCSLYFLWMKITINSWQLVDSVLRTFKRHVGEDRLQFWNDQKLHNKINKSTKK